MLMSVNLFVLFLLPAAFISLRHGMIVFDSKSRTRILNMHNNEIWKSCILGFSDGGKKNKNQNLSFQQLK